jgi:hypothetical protein
MDAGLAITLVGAIGSALITVGTGVGVVWKLGGAWGSMTEHVKNMSSRVDDIGSLSESTAAKVESLDTRVYTLERAIGTESPTLKAGGA